MGKRDIGEIEVVDVGTSKKLKQGYENRGESTNSIAEAVQQPRGSP